MASIAEEALLASGARTTTQTLVPTLPQKVSGLITDIEVVIDTTAAATGSVTPAIQAFDEGAGTWRSVLTGAAITGTGTVVLRYGLSAPVVANLSQNGIPPKQWRVLCTANNANSQTYSVSARVRAA